MEAINNTNKSKAYRALFYLVTRLLKEQVGLLVTILVFSLIIAILPLLFVGKSDTIVVSYGEVGFFGWVTWVPSLLVCLAILPIVHQQIFSSSILKRLKASGITSMTYAIVMIGAFALTATIMFWVITLISQPIYASIYNGYDLSIRWFSFVFVTPIIWWAFATTGILIGNWRIPEILKGILIFFIFGIITVFSMTVMNTEILDFDYFSGLKTTYLLLAINPWGLLINTVHYSVVPNVDTTFFGISIVMSILLSGTLFLIALHRISLR